MVRKLLLVPVLLLCACNQNLTSFCQNGSFPLTEGSVILAKDNSQKSLGFGVNIKKNGKKYNLHLTGGKGNNTLNIDIENAKDILEYSGITIDATDFEPANSMNLKAKLTYNSRKASGKYTEEIMDHNLNLTIKDFNYVNDLDYSISGTFSGKDEKTGKEFSGQFQTEINPLIKACDRHF